MNRYLPLMNVQMKTGPCGVGSFVQSSSSSESIFSGVFGWSARRSSPVSSLVIGRSSRSANELSSAVRAAFAPRQSS
jgi:hypothetical protein